MEVTLDIYIKVNQERNIPLGWLTNSEVKFKVFQRILPYRIGESVVPRLLETLVNGKRKYHTAYETREVQNRLVVYHYYSPETVDKLVYLIKKSYCIYGKNTTKVKLPLSDISFHYIRRLN